MKNIKITLSNVHKWGKPKLTTSGDIRVATDLARANKAPVIVSATLDEDFDDLRSLHPDVEFEKWTKDSFSEEDIVVIPILDFRKVDEKVRDELISFYNSSLSTNLVIFNICHDQYFYSNQIASSNDADLVNLAKEMLAKSFYYAHSEDMIDDKLDLKPASLGLIVFIEEDRFKDRDKLGEFNVTFYRPSRFKGFRNWLKEVSTNDDKYIGLINASRLKDFSELSDMYGIGSDIKLETSLKSAVVRKDQFDKVLVDSSYNLNSLEFRALMKNAKSYLATTDYSVLKEDNPTFKEWTYLIIEYAHLDALYAGVPIRFAESSIKDLSEEAKLKADTFNGLTAKEQFEILKEEMSPTKLLTFLSKQF